MVTIREEKLSDALAREVLLDEAYGAGRFTKTSERLREGRLPAAGWLSLQFITARSSAPFGCGPSPPGRRGRRSCSGRWRFIRSIAIAASARP